MAAATLAITAERLAPAPLRVGPAGRPGDPDHRDGDSGARVAAVEPGLGPLPWPGAENQDPCMLPRTLTLLACVFAAVPRHPAIAQTASDGNWTMPAKDYAATRYSALAEINASNARTSSGLDILDRCSGRARGPAAGGQQHDVSGDA